MEGKLKMEIGKNSGQLKTLNEFRRQFLNTEIVPESEFVLFNKEKRPVEFENKPVVVRVRRDEGTIVFDVAGLRVPYIHLMPALQDVAPGAVYATEKMPETLDVEEETPRTTFNLVQKELRNLLGNLSPEEWEKAQYAFADLRREIDQMKWFEMGPNSVGAEKDGQYWSQLVLAPRDSEHRHELEEILAELGIYPWFETQQNVPVLVVENPRDIALLSTGFIFEYLLDSKDRGARLHRLEEERQKLEKTLRAKQAERQRIIQMDLDKEEFRKQTKEERERYIAEVMNSISHLINKVQPINTPVSLSSDRYYNFGYPRRGKPRVSPKESLPEHTVPEQVEVEDVDVDLKKIEEDFRLGILNEDSLLQELVQSVPVSKRDSVNLALFPRKYDWIPPEGKRPGVYREKVTQKIIKEEDIERLIENAKGDTQESHVAVRELILIYRALILYLIRSLKEVFPAADPDDLFQGALRGLKWTVDRYERREGGSFKKYLMPSMEGFMRRELADTMRSVRTPQRVSGLRKKILDAQKAVRAQSPERDVRTKEVIHALNKEGVLSDRSPVSYDRFLRRVLWDYKKVEPEVLEKEDITLDKVDMLGDPLFFEATQVNDREKTEFKKHLSKVLSDLSPREERVVRTYFELDQSGVEADKIYQELANEFDSPSAMAMKKRIRDLTAMGDLTDPEEVGKLSIPDQQLLKSYQTKIDLIQHISLDSVGEKLGVTRERIRQILAKALRRMSHPNRSKIIQEYL